MQLIKSCNKKLKFFYGKFIPNVNEGDFFSNHVKKEFAKAGIILKTHGETAVDFKKAFILKTKFYLDWLIKKVGKAATLWFDEKRETEYGDLDNNIIPTNNRKLI